MPRETPEKAVEAFIDEVDHIIFGDDEIGDQEKLKRIRELCADTRLAIMSEELS